MADGLAELHSAARHGDVRSMKELISRGVDVNAVVHGRSVLAQAAASGEYTISSLLLKARADPNGHCKV